MYKKKLDKDVQLRIIPHLPLISIVSADGMQCLQAHAVEEEEYEEEEEEGEEEEEEEDKEGKGEEEEVEDSTQAAGHAREEILMEEGEGV